MKEKVPNSLFLFPQIIVPCLIPFYLFRLNLHSPGRKGNHFYPFLFLSLVLKFITPFPITTSASLLLPPLLLLLLLLLLPALVYCTHRTALRCSPLLSALTCTHRPPISPQIPSHPSHPPPLHFRQLSCSLPDIIRFLLISIYFYLRRTRFYLILYRGSARLACEPFFRSISFLVFSNWHWYCHLEQRPFSCIVRSSVKKENFF